MAAPPRSVAVLSRSFSKHPVLRAELQARHPRAVFNDSGRTLAGEELEKLAVRWATGRGNRNGRCAYQFARQWVGLQLLETLP